MRNFSSISETQVGAADQSEVHQSASADGRQKDLEIHGLPRPRSKTGFASKETQKACGRGGGSCAVFGVVKLYGFPMPQRLKAAGVALRHKIGAKRQC